MRKILAAIFRRVKRPHIHLFRDTGLFSFEPGEGSTELFKCRCGTFQLREDN